MVSKKKRNARKEQGSGGVSHPSFKYKDNSQRRGDGGRDGNWNGRSNNHNNGRTRSWRSDNVGSKFTKFRESNKQYRGTSNMNGYSRYQTYYYDQYNYHPTEQQNMTQIAPSEATAFESSTVNPPTVKDMTTENAALSNSTTVKPTIVKDLTIENEALKNFSAANAGEIALTELKKDVNLPLRFPMETIENTVAKIKLEKTDQIESKPKLDHKSSSSSSSSSDEETNCDKKKEVEAPKYVAQKHKRLHADDKKKKCETKAEHKLKKSSEPVSTPKQALSSSSEEEETASETESSSSEDHPHAKTAVVNNKPSKKLKKDKKLIMEIKLNSDEDVECLGKAKSKFSLDDEESDSGVTISKSKKSSEICILCDKQGHTSFECQMICKNCTKPYHNLKNCPRPANISLIMQNFMDFLLQQMAKYNPQAAYPFDQHLKVNAANFENAQPSQPLAPGSPSVSSTHGKRKRTQTAAKLESVTKKPLKKRRNHKSNKKDTESDEFSSPSPSESETTSEDASEVLRRKNLKKTKGEQSFVSPFPGHLAMPAYSALPGYGAAPSFNPMLPMLNQMIQNGYPVHGAFNFKQ